MAATPLQTSQAIASTVFDELEQKGFVLSIPTEDGDKTPTKDFANALIDAILKGLKDNVTVSISGNITCPPNGGPAIYALTGNLVII